MGVSTTSRGSEFVALGHPGNEPYAGLETFANPGVAEVELVSDELTAVCPITGQPDLYRVAIEYRPRALSRVEVAEALPELFRNEGFSARRSPSGSATRLPPRSSWRRTLSDRARAEGPRRDHDHGPCLTPIHRRIRSTTSRSSSAARQSAKWARYPPDVLPAWVAELDFPLAPPVREASAQAVSRDDTGYPDASGSARRSRASPPRVRLGGRPGARHGSSPTSCRGSPRCSARSPARRRGRHQLRPSTRRSSRSRASWAGSSRRRCADRDGMGSSISTGSSRPSRAAPASTAVPSAQPDRHVFAREEL